MSPSVFAHPEALLGWGALWLLLGLGLAFAFHRGERQLREALGTTPGSWDRRARDLVLWIALGATTLALAGPRFGTRELRVPASGLDAVLLLDLSRSMDAPDNPPSRLIRARELAAGVLARLGEGDRAALAVFAGQAAALTPLTPDKGALAEMLPSLDTSLMAHTASLGHAAIEEVLPTFDGSGLRPRVLLVLSDGEIGPVGRELTEELVRREIRVLAALVGTETGSRIPESNRWMLDAEGRPVRTRREVGRLAPLLAATGGRAFLADAWGELDLEAVTSEVRREAIPSSDGTIRRRIPVTWVALPAGLALLLLCLEAWPGLLRREGPRQRPASERGTRHLAGRPRARAFTLGGALLAVTLSDAAAPEDSPNERDPRRLLEERIARDAGDAGLLIALGLERVRAGDADEARHAFRAAAARARRPEQAALAWYDLGVLALEQGRLDDARDAFLDATTASAEDRALDLKVKFNLEWTLAALGARDEPPPPSPSPLQDPDATSDEAEDPAEDPSLEDDAMPHEGDATDTPDADATQSDQGDDSGGDPETSPSRTAPAPLDPEEARRWFDRVEDDVRAAIEARLADSRKAERGGPRW